MNPVSEIQAVEYRDLGSATPVWNLNQVNYYIWVKIPNEVARHSRLYAVKEINLEDQSEADISVSAFEQCSLVYIRIIAQILNMKVGKHTHKLEFVDTVTGDIFYLFFSYIIQNDNPDRPYVYMRDRPGGSSSTSYDENWVDRR